MVLRRAAQHRGSANVNVLNRIVQAHAWAGHRLFKGVKIHHHQIKRLYSMFFEKFPVFGNFTTSQKPHVYMRMESADAAIHDFGKTRDLAHLRDFQTVFAQKLRSAPSGNNFTS